MLRDWYLYVLLIFALVGGWMQLWGWAPSNYERIPNVPPTVRSNPGSYRSHYQNTYVHIGGK